METQQPKQIYYQDEAYCFMYDIAEGKVFLHCEVKKWNSQILRTGYRVFGEFLNEMENKGFSEILTVTPNPRYAELFGGVGGESFIHENITYKVVRWELKPYSPLGL